MIGSLEECLLDIKDSVNVQDWNDVESDILEQIDVVLIVVNDTVEELEDYIEWHLNRDCLTCMMSTCDEHSRTLICWLLARLKLDKRDITAFICLSEARYCDVVRELFMKLVDDDE